MLTQKFLHTSMVSTQISLTCHTKTLDIITQSLDDHTFKLDVLDAELGYQCSAYDSKWLISNSKSIKLDASTIKYNSTIYYEIKVENIRVEFVRLSNTTSVVQSTGSQPLINGVNLQQ